MLGFNSVKSAVFVILQFSIIILFFITGKIFPENISLIIIFISGILLGIYSIVTMKLNFNISPDLKPGAGLVIKGPYKFIRHPMYTSIFLVLISLLINEFTPLRLIFYIVLTVVLILKSDYEENLLKNKFGEYGEYIGRTKKFIPYIF